MAGSRKLVWLSLGGGLLVLAGMWLVLSIRARQSERLRLGRSAQKPPVLPRMPEAGRWERPDTAPPEGESPAPADLARRPEKVDAPPTLRPERVKTEEQKALEATIPFLRKPEPGEVPGLQAKVQDLSVDPKERVKALARLRGASPDGRSSEVVRSMIDLLRTSSDPVIRADICRHLKGIRSEDLKQQLLITARTENDPLTREEAVESLAPMRTDFAVNQALRTIFATDPVERVRNQAKRSLSGAP